MEKETIAGLIASMARYAGMLKEVEKALKEVEKPLKEVEKVGEVLNEIDLRSIYCTSTTRAPTLER